MATTAVNIPAAVNAVGRIQGTVNCTLSPAQALTLRRVYLGMVVEQGLGNAPTVPPRSMNDVIPKLLDIIGAAI